jgi:hypothetical protein
VKRGWGRLLVIGVILMMSVSAAAQGSPLVAVVNSSGQLVVSSGDGGYRWIVTNPGETLVGTYEWSGSQIIFAVYDGGEISVRVGDVNAQRVYEIGRGAGSSATIGGVTGGNAVVALDDRIGLYPLNGSGGFEIGARGALSENATNGGAIFMRGDDGSYGLIAPDGSSITPLSFASDPNAPFVNLWSRSLVAYADYGIGSPLSVTDANTGETVTLNSDGSIPLIPLAWAGSTLIYRGTGGTIRLADLSCLNCGANPLENGVDLLPGSATEVKTDGSWAYFLDGETVGAVDLGCVNRGDCLNSAQIIGMQAAPETGFDVSGGALVYTAYTSSPYDLADRVVRAYDVRCLGGGCQPSTDYGGMTAGYLSADGRYAIVQDANGGLSAWSLRDGGAAYLSDGGELLNVRWSA